MKLSKRASAGICLALAFLTAGCGPLIRAERKDQTVYRVSISGCCFWFNRVSEAQAKALGSYQATYYNGEGREYRQDDFIAGEFFFRSDFEYDRAGRITRVELLSADGQSEIFLYDYYETGEASRIKHTRADGVTVVFLYDEDGKPVSD